jgi:hypothetical protein
VDSDKLSQPIGDDAGEGLAAAMPGDVHEPAQTEAPSDTERPPTVGQMRRERKRLWDERQEFVYHLGGLALDLHGREMLGDELIARRAEVVTETDRRILELDELLKEADDGRRRRRRVQAPEPVVGYCLGCGAPHQTDAAFCFRCGARISSPEAESDTQVIAMPEDGQ